MKKYKVTEVKNKDEIKIWKDKSQMFGVMIFILLFICCFLVIMLNKQQENDFEIQEPIIKELQIDYLEIQINGTNFTMRNFSMDYDKVSLDSLIFQMDDLK